MTAAPAVRRESAGERTFLCEIHPPAPQEPQELRVADERRLQRTPCLGGIRPAVSLQREQQGQIELGVLGHPRLGDQPAHGLGIGGCRGAVPSRAGPVALADGEGAGWPAATRWRPELAEQADLGAVVDVLDGDAKDQPAAR
jgi:hypothetical protein